MLLRCHILCGLAALLWAAESEEPPANNVGELLVKYESYISASLSLDKTDRVLMSTWSTEFQVKQVNITSHYRLDMNRHREHCFRGKKTNPKWKDCISLHQKEINKSKVSYFESEKECLKTANSADEEKVQAVHQLEKEIRKWRKSYRYLSNVCVNDHPADDDAASLCLVENVKRDNYDVAFQRLLMLKLEAMDNLLVRLNSALTNLEECLKDTFYEYMNTIRNIMTTLNKCYSVMNKETTTELYR